MTVEWWCISQKKERLLSDDEERTADGEITATTPTAQVTTTPRGDRASAAQGQYGSTRRSGEEVDMVTEGQDRSHYQLTV